MSAKNDKERMRQALYQFYADFSDVLTGFEEVFDACASGRDSKDAARHALVALRELRLTVAVRVPQLVGEDRSCGKMMASFDGFHADFGRTLTGFEEFFAACASGHDAKDAARRALVALHDLKLTVAVCTEEIERGGV